MKKSVRYASFVIAILLTLTILPAKGVLAAVSGADIVNCAMQYLGRVPYVWGGTNIDGDNPGADCSGFICRIYEKFGINMWANRTSLRNCGTNLGTDMNVARAGDIIWYSGHVAIYSGMENGHHMIVHETGGSFQNVVYTKHSVVSAELRGIIRIPGVDGYAAPVSEPNVIIERTTAPDYLAKEMISDTNAVVVNRITKPSGTSVSQMGIYLYDANGQLIKKHSETVTNVPPTQTTYHSWFDINAELGVTLSPGTTYTYNIYGIFNGTEVVGTGYTFTTTGQAPVTVVPPAPEPEPEQPPVKEEQPVNAIFQSQNSMDNKGVYLIDVSNPRLHVESIYVGDYDLEAFTVYIEDLNGRLVKRGILPDSHIEGLRGRRTAEINWDISNEVINSMNPDAKYRFFAEMYLSNGKRYVSELWSCRLYGFENQNNSSNKKGNVEIKLIINYPDMFVNGKSQKIDDNKTAPVIKNSRTLLPIRAVIENMGGDVKWQDKTRTVSMKLDGKTLFLQIDNDVCWDDEGNTYPLDCAPTIINNRTMLPIRFVVEYFGGKVGWDPKTREVSINY